MKCQGKTSNGKKCKRLVDDKYCWQHIKKSQNGGGDIIPAPNKNEWTIYGKDYCGYTQAAREKLQSYAYHNIEQNTKEEINAFKRSHGIPSNYNTVPMIFDKSAKFIGGYDKL